MKFSYFSGLKNTLPNLRELPWTEFVTTFGDHLEITEKNNAALISPAEWAPGVTRSKNTVLQVHFAALDLDKVSDEAVETVLKTLEPCQYFLHTTHSHAASNLNCLRVYLPISRPVEGAQWPKFWNGLNALVGGIMDPACSDASRVYYVPSMPPGTKDKNYTQVHDGQVLDADLLLNMRAPKPSQALSEFALRQTLIDFSRSLRGRKDTYLKNMGALLSKVSRGEVFAEPGERDTVLFKLCALLAEALPRMEPAQIADFFKESLLKMEAAHPGAPTLTDVIEKIERQQTQVEQEIVKRKKALMSSLQEDIFEAFAGRRDTAYSEEELDGFAAEAGVTRTRLNKRWIIRKGDNCYLFVGGEYGSPVSVGELVDAAKIDLAAASSSGVDFIRYSSKGQPIPKSEKDLLRDYSTLARQIRADLAAQKSTYDWKTKTLIEAPCPLRNLKPEFNADVDRYLTLLGGKYAEQLLDWVSLVTKLDAPCAALFLHGEPGAGKSLLTLGLSRLWTTGTPTQIRDVLSNFNDSLVGSPLVVADEKIHSSNHKEVGSAELRNLIQEYSRPLRRKFQSNSTLMGALRVIITANNKTVLGWKENLNGSDIKAIEDRILSIHVGMESAVFLRTLSNEQRRAFVDQDVIAKHALWLRDNRVHSSNARFLVEGCDKTFHMSLVTTNGINSAVLHWLVGYLQDPERLDNKGVYHVRVHEGRLLVNVQALLDQWDLYKTNTDKYSAVAHRISASLSNMSEQKKKQLPNGLGVNTCYWKFQTDYLLNWSQETGYASEEQILTALSKNSILPGRNR